MGFILSLNHLTAGWQVLMPAAVIFGVGATYLIRTRRETAIPWFSLITWLAVCCVVYALSDVHSLFGYARRSWTAIILLGAVHSAIPIAVGLLAVFAAPVRKLRWQAQAAVVVASGIAAIPLASAIHEWLGPHVYGWLHVG